VSAPARATITLDPMPLPATANPVPDTETIEGFELSKVAATGVLSPSASMAYA
jgi:hypothetical protein